jgi:hypothetical protein
MKNNSIIISIKFIFIIICLNLQSYHSYGSELENNYNWQIYRNNYMIAHGVLNVNYQLFKNTINGIFDTNDEYTAFHQLLYSGLDDKLAVIFQEYLKFTITVNFKEKIIQNIDDNILHTFLNYKTCIYSTLKLIGYPVHNCSYPKFIRGKNKFLCCCKCCCCNNIELNINQAEECLENAIIARRINSGANINSYLNITYTDENGNQSQASKKLNNKKSAIINIFACNEDAIDLLKKIFNSQIQLKQSLVIIPFDKYPQIYQIYLEKYLEARQISDNLEVTHKIVFIDFYNFKRKVKLYLNSSRGNILLLSCQYTTKSDFLLQIQLLQHSAVAQIAPPAYEDVK